MRVAQVINALDRADAVSLCLLEMDRMLRELGHDTQIFFESAHKSLASRGRPVSGLRPDAADLVLFHYAGYSRILSRVARCEGKRGIVFHNVTPAHFFEGVPETYEFCQRAVAQLPTLPALFDFGVGVSAFNAQTLDELGFAHTRVHPIAWETSGLGDVEPDAAVLARDRDAAVRLLVVARIAPHKGVHYAVRALPEIQRTLGREVRLVLVGKTGGYEAYIAELRAAIRETGVSSSVELTGEVSNEELRAHYARADVLLQLSEHEGFCVPLVEAMAFGVPIVAAPAGAIAGTLGGAGVLLEDRSPGEIARGVAAAVGEGRAGLVAAQQERVRAFSRPAVRDGLSTLLEWATDVPRNHAPVGRLPRASVVVCTYNRAQVLGDCLEGLRRLDYSEFEVVVVEGPSTDGTSAVLDRFPDVKRVTTAERNLSVSRNIGIAASVGEIAAFIDDDAVPEPGWLRDLVEAFDDPTVGGAGGDVFGPDGTDLQFSNGVLSDNGNVITTQEQPDDRNDPDGFWRNTLMGTNTAFRRSVLDEIGGFDEHYEYFHDEADLCARVIDAGHRVEHRPRAVVWHGFAPGTSRKSKYDVDFTRVVKNTIYFSLGRNGWRRRPWRLAGPLPTVLRHAGWTVLRRFERRLDTAQAARILRGWWAGLVQGYQKALRETPRPQLAERVATCAAPAFVPYAKQPRGHGRRRLHVALVSQQYPPDECGGIGVYTEQLARGLVREGHRVTVLAAGRHAALNVRDGVEVYRIPGAEAPDGIPYGFRVTRKNLARSLGVEEVLSWLVRDEGVDIVESPIWDAEGYAASMAGRVPLVLRLNTPLALGAEIQGWGDGPDFQVAAGMEWRLLGNASGVIDPSGTILDTIASRYDAKPSDVPTEEIPFGTPLPPEAAKEDGADVRFLFLGRLERRKGADTLLAAIPAVLDACPAARFELAGDGEGEFAPERLREALSASHRERVRFHGFVGDEVRERLYAEADVFVAPSRYESFGIVYLEAMAHGCVCVAGNAGGPTRIVTPSTGVLVDPDDPAALARTLITLTENADERRAMGRAARHRVEERYTLDGMVHRTIDFYERVLAGASGSSPS